MNLNTTLLKLLIKPQKKKFKVWLRDRALQLPEKRIQQIATDIEPSILDIADKAGVDRDVVRLVLNSLDFEGMVRHFNQAVINDVLNAVEKEL